MEVSGATEYEIARILLTWEGGLPGTLVRRILDTIPEVEEPEQGSNPAYTTRYSRTDEAIEKIRALPIHESLLDDLAEIIDDALEDEIDSRCDSYPDW